MSCSRFPVESDRCVHARMLRRLQGEGSGHLPIGGTNAGLGGNGSGGAQVSAELA